MPRQAVPVNVNITTLHGFVVIQFSQPIPELTLLPEDAAQLAKKLAEATKSLTPGRGKLIL